jgi:prephenate dehydrogenase
MKTSKDKAVERQRRTPGQGAACTPRHVTIIGVGLLGASMGLALKRRLPGVRVAGVGRRAESLRQALRIGAIDTAHLDAREAVSQSDLVILATPVGAFEGYLRAIRPLLRPGAWVTDVGSTKAEVVRAARRVLGAGGAFIGSHPMAGSERKGPAHAREDLFEGATCVLTPTAGTPRGLVVRAERLWRGLGMKVVRMTPAEHDRAVAAVSHLPHLASALLTLLPRGADLAVAASGLRDMTRLAGGDPEMWRDILLTNRREVLRAIDRLTRSVAGVRRLVASVDAAAIEKFLQRAKRQRDAAFGTG